MSADVQPRKRKDKRKKRESLDSKSEEDIITRKLSLKDDEDTREHHGVHVTKMGIDDVHLHIQGEHSTGGHWCAKVFFFSLLAILIGLIGLIIIENRGLSDLDTPLSESRFSEYFEGWVDEHRESHDDHDKIPPELENHDGEPFEEEEDHSEIDEDDEHEDRDEEKDEHDDEEIVDQSVEQSDEMPPNDDLTIDRTEEENDEEEEEEEEEPHMTEERIDDEENEDDDEIQPSEEVVYNRNKRELDDEEEDVDEGFSDMQTDDENDNNPSEEDKVESEQRFQQPSSPPESNPFVAEDPYEEDDDDFESLETNVVDNDAYERTHLEQKVKQAQELVPSAEEQEKEEEQSSSKIKSRPGGGPQSYTEEDLIEEQLRRANEDMLQNQFDFQ